MTNAPAALYCPIVVEKLVLGMVKGFISAFGGRDRTQTPSRSFEGNSVATLATVYDPALL